MIFHVKAAGKQLREYKLHLHGLFLFLGHGVITVLPMLRVLSGTQEMLNTYEVLGIDMRCYINDVIDSAGLYFSQ